MREVLRGHAERGHTVLVSSHPALRGPQLADDVRDHRGRPAGPPGRRGRATGPARRQPGARAHAAPDRLLAALNGAGRRARRGGLLHLTGLDTAAVFRAAVAAASSCTSWCTSTRSLERVFLELTSGGRRSDDAAGPERVSKDRHHQHLVAVPPGGARVHGAYVRAQRAPGAQLPAPARPAAPGQHPARPGAAIRADYQARSAALVQAATL